MWERATGAEIGFPLVQPNPSIRPAVMRALTRILFAFGRRSSGYFEAHCANELVEVINDALVETVELRLLVRV